MSRRKVPQQETLKNVAGVAKSSSLNRHETKKVKGEEPSEGTRKLGKNVVSKPKFQEGDSSALKESVKSTSVRKTESVSTKRTNEINARQSKPLTSKPAGESHALKDQPTSRRPQVELNVGSNGRSKDQSKTLLSSKTSPVAARSNVKKNEVSSISPQISDRRKGGVSQQPIKAVKSIVPVKTAVAKNKSEKGDGDKRNHYEGDDVGIGDGRRLSRERTKTRTLNPEDSQLLTALQHAAQQLPQEIASKSSQDDAGYDYEDDFEDYESDFEEATSLESSSGEESDDHSKLMDGKEDDDDDDKDNYDYGDSSSSISDLQINKDVHLSINGKVGVEEKKMDSGHYDMTEERRLTGKATGVILVPNHVLHNKDTSIREQRTLAAEESSGKNYEIKFINFAQAKRRQQERKASSRMKQRGEILLNMIRLDSVSLPLFEKAPIPYEIYMRSYGRSNTQQVSSQTNEDGISEEVQTDEIVLKSKWTQHPPAFIQLDNSIAHPLICSVSSDPCNEEDLMVWKQGAKVDGMALEKFVLNAGQLMLNILEEMSSGTQGLLKANKVDLGFSQGFTTLGTESVPFLKDRRVSRICFVPHQPNSLLSIHVCSEKINVDDDLPSQMVKRCILCLWNLLQPSQPVKMLVSSSNVTACTFHPERPHLVFAGLVDGILNVWDLKEQSPFTNGVLFQDVEWNLRSPSYITVTRHGERHSSAVVGIQVIDNVADSPSKSPELSPTQICSLDESGLCLVWTVLRGSSGTGEDPGIAPWGCIRLLLNESYSVAHHVRPVMEDDANVQFLDLALDGRDPGHMLVAANTGHVVHCLSGGGGRAHPPVYLADWDCLSPATCICPCPFGLPYFLVGCGDGTARLHSRLSERPLLSVAGSGGAVGSGPAITRLQWSTSRPCVFFVLDSESRLHVWDLGFSDMYPMLTVPFRGKTITTMQLSPTRHTAKACPYLALGTSCGRLKVHLVKEELASTSLEDTAVELDKFKRYVTIL